MTSNRGAFAGANVRNTQGDVFGGNKIVGSTCVDLQEFVNDPVHKSVGLAFWLMSQGVALVVAGVYIFHLFDEVAAIVGTEYEALCIWIISGGVFIFIVAAIGIIGACRRVFWLIVIFSALSVVIFVSELASGVWGFLLQDQVQQTVLDRMNQSMRLINAHDVREGWEYIHQNFQCCGLVDHNDWSGILSEPPESCCKIPESDRCSLRTFSNTSPMYTKSCRSVAIRWMRHYTIVVSVVAVCSAFFQMFGILSSICLALIIRNPNNTTNTSNQNETTNTSNQNETTSASNQNETPT